MSYNFKIVLVEDDSILSKVIQYELKKQFECEVYAFKTGEDALLKEDLKADIFIIDYYLPGINGNQVLEGIYEANIDAKFIAISGKAQNEIVQRFFAGRGVDHCIEKEPLFINNLVGVIGEIVSEWDVYDQEYSNHFSFDKKIGADVLSGSLIGLLMLVSVLFLFFEF